MKFKQEYLDMIKQVEIDSGEELTDREKNICVDAFILGKIKGVEQSNERIKELI